MMSVTNPRTFAFSGCLRVTRTVSPMKSAMTVLALSSPYSLEERDAFLKVEVAGRRNRKNLGLIEKRVNCGCCGIQGLAVSLQGGTGLLVKTSSRKISSICG